MERVAHMVARHWIPQLSRRLVPADPAGGHGRAPGAIRASFTHPGRGIVVSAIVVIVIVADLTWAAVLASRFTLRAADQELLAGQVACGAATAALNRRAARAPGAVPDAYAVWELPVAIHLPLLYALVVPAVRLALARDDPARGAGPAGHGPRPGGGLAAAPAARRAYAAAAAGLAYGGAALAFRALAPAGGDPRAILLGGPARWLLAASCCALAQWLASRALLAVAAPGGAAAEPTASAVRLSPGGATPRAPRGGADEKPRISALLNDACELCAAILVALGIAVSPLALFVAFPLGTLLQRSRRHAQLLSDARADGKTGLLNAAAWEQEARAEVARAVRTGSPLAVALLDLDKFKLINDTHGHLAGDQVLKRIAAAMTEVLRDYDVAGRFGGEEFVMLLPQTRATDALRIAERVRAHIAELAVDAGTAGAERVTVTVSIGVAALDAGSRRELTELLSAADAALYRAKASGRDQVQMLSTSRGLSAVRPTGGGLFGQLAGDGAGDAGDAGRSSTATTSALAVLHSDVTPFFSTCGVGNPWQVHPLIETGAPPPLPCSEPSLRAAV
ncbi:MAG TPA: GGDEF domain-containing protein [Trebonia sp.]|nr:GGDEF domain-containing protein [Trebonia sp.]